MKAILFDLDGTLADSFPAILQSSYLTCEELNIPWDEKRIISYIGLPLIQTGENLLGQGHGQIYFDTYQKHFFAISGTLITLFAGVDKMLQSLKDAGFALGIVTSKSKIGTDYSLHQLQIADYFEVIVHADLPCGHKPQPGPALYGLQQLQAAEGIMVGDSVFDIMCGQDAGLTTVGVTWGACDAPQLQAAGAELITATVSELTGLLLKIAQ